MSAEKKPPVTGQINGIKYEIGAELFEALTKKGIDPVVEVEIVLQEQFHHEIAVKGANYE